MFIINTTAANVTDRPFRSCKWGVVKGCTCRERQTEQVTQRCPGWYSMPYGSYSV